MSAFAKIKSWFRRVETAVEDEAEGATPVTTRPGEPAQESSTNAQVEGAVGQPWPDEQ